jgi:hypothetical protein
MDAEAARSRFGHHRETAFRESVTLAFAIGPMHRLRSKIGKWAPFSTTCGVACLRGTRQNLLQFCHNYSLSAAQRKNCIKNRHMLKACPCESGLFRGNLHS